MAYELIDRDIHANGVIDNYFYDADIESLVVHTTYETDALMDANTAARNDGSNGFNKARDCRKIAELDPVTIHKLLVEENIDVFNPADNQRLLAWLRNRDNRGFTTVSGRF